MTNPPNQPSDENVGGATCPTCGAENRPGSRFCERCGTRLPQTARDAHGSAVPAPTDATVTFDRRTNLDAGDAPAASSPPQSTDRAGATSAASSPATGAGQQLSPPSPRDAPTMSFDLPALPTPSPSTERAESTLSFDLPPSVEPAPAAARGEDTPASAEGAGSATDPERANWDYQPWKPQQPGERAPEPVEAEATPIERGATRPSVTPPPVASEPFIAEPPRQEAPPPPAPPVSPVSPQGRESIPNADIWAATSAPGSGAASTRLVHPACRADRDQHHLPDARCRAGVWLPAGRRACLESAEHRLSRARRGQQ